MAQTKLFGGKLRYYLIVCVKAHNDCVYTFDKFGIGIDAFIIAAATIQPIDLSAAVCDITVKTHCNI